MVFFNVMKKYSYPSYSGNEKLNIETVKSLLIHNENVFHDYAILACSSGEFLPFHQKNIKKSIS